MALRNIRKKRGMPARMDLTSTRTACLLRASIGNGRRWQPQLAEAARQRRL